jgi:hypothetical protein
VTLRSGRLAAAFAACLLIAACGAVDDRPGVATASPGATSSIADDVVRTRARVLEALGAARFQARDAQVSFRPAESPEVAAAPRRVLQVLLRDDPQGLFVSIYGFADPATAAEAGRRQAAHVASGPIRIQYPQDVRFVLRRVGATLVFLVWAPSTTADPDAAGIEDALMGLGAEVPVPG